MFYYSAPVFTDNWWFILIFFNVGDMTKENASWDVWKMFPPFNMGVKIKSCSTWTAPTWHSSCDASLSGKVFLLKSEGRKGASQITACKTLESVIK